MSSGFLALHLCFAQEGLHVSTSATLHPVVPAFGALRGVSETALALASAQVDAVLAVVVATHGEVERKRGAMALIEPRGVRAGTLAGGGVEARLEAAAHDVFASGSAGTVTIALADDSAPQRATIAETASALQVVMLPMPAPASSLRDALATACSDGAWLRLRIGLGIDERNTLGLGRGEARAGSRVFAFEANGLPCNAPVMFQRHVSLAFAPPPRVVLLGAGPETPVLSRMARLLGWYVDIVEARPRHHAYIDAASTDRVHAIVADGLPKLIAESHYDAAIVASHDYATDARLLHHLGGAGIGYVGLVGSPERRDALLASLGDIVATQLEPRLYAPAGLRLGGDGPESVALSIIAQLQHYLAHDAHA